MPLIAKNKGGNFEPVPAGNHIARCYQVIHIGTNTETILGKTQDIDKVRLTFELPNETKVFKEGDGPKPYSISKEYTVSMHEKAHLRKLIDGWFGKALDDEAADEFDVTTLIGQVCMLNVIHKKTKSTGKLFADISSASPLPKGLEAPEAVNVPMILTFDDWDDKAFEKLPEFLQNKMKTSQEYRQKFNPETAETPISADDIPFD